MCLLKCTHQWLIWYDSTNTQIQHAIQSPTVSWLTTLANVHQQRWSRYKLRSLELLSLAFWHFRAIALLCIDWHSDLMLPGALWTFVFILFFLFCHSCVILSCAKYFCTISILDKYQKCYVCWWQNGFTPLHLASQEGHTDMVTLLLERKANCNSRAKNGLTPMHLAAQEDHVPVAEILVKYKAHTDPQTKVSTTSTALLLSFWSQNMAFLILTFIALTTG